MKRLRHNRKGLLLFAAAFAAALGFTCSSGERKAPSPAELRMPPAAKPAEAKLIFSHKLHFDAEMACADCHGKAGSIALPAERGDGPNCLDCHDEVGERDKPGKGCALCHKAADHGVEWPQSPRTPGLIFSHAKHGDQECADCHAGYDKLEGPLG